MIGEPRLLTLTHAAQILKCSFQQAKVLFDQGILRGMRDSGGRRLIEAASLEEYRRKRRPHRQKVTAVEAAGEVR